MSDQESPLLWQKYTYLFTAFGVSIYAVTSYLTISKNDQKEATKFTIIKLTKTIRIVSSVYMRSFLILRCQSVLNSKFIVLYTSAKRIQQVTLVKTRKLFSGEENTFFHFFCHTKVVQVFELFISRRYQFHLSQCTNNKIFLQIFCAKKKTLVVLN